MKTSFKRPACATPDIVVEPEEVSPQKESIAVASPEKVDHDDTGSLGFPRVLVQRQLEKASFGVKE